MDLTTFRLRIQSVTGLAAATAGHYEQSLVDGWVNEGVVQFLVKTKAVKKTAHVTIDPGVGDYTIDDDVLALEDLHIGSRMLDVVDTATIRRWRLNGNSGSNEVGKFAYEGQTIMLYPTPSGTDELHMIYVRRPTPMTSGGHDPSLDAYGAIPAEYHPVIEAYAKWKGGEYSNDQPSQNGMAWKQEFEQGVMQAKIIETRKAGVNVQRAIPGWRNKQGVGIAPGIDQGY